MEPIHLVHSTIDRLKVVLSSNNYLFMQVHGKRIFQLSRAEWQAVHLFTESVQSVPRPCLFEPGIVQVKDIFPFQKSALAPSIFVVAGFNEKNSK